MTGPQYVNDLSSLYMRMYAHPGHERPLNEKHHPPTHTNHEVEEENDPDWKKKIRKLAKKNKRHMPPTIADVPRDDIPDAYENEEEVVRESPMMLARMAIPYAAGAIQNFVAKHGRREKEERESDEEENQKASLAIKLVLELIGDAKHDEAAANALNMIRDLVK
jgi:hypothetical protein